MTPKPPPFNRPSVDLTASEVKRSWQWIPASEVVVGDIWSGAGAVRAVEVTQDRTDIYAGETAAPWVLSSDSMLHVFHEVPHEQGD